MNSKSEYLTMLIQSSVYFSNPKQNWIGFTNRQLSSLFQDITSLLRIEMLVELGAHAAEASSRFMHSSHAKNALAFEANPYTFEKFHLEFRGSKLEYKNMAVASKCGQERIQIPNFQKNQTPGNASILSRKGVNTSDSALVEAHTLDCLGFKERGIEFPKFSKALWIDCEGAGGQILESGENMLNAQSTKMVFVELEEIEFWENQILAADVFQYLGECGFSAVARDFTPRPQYNVLFVKNEIIASVANRVSIYWKTISSKYADH
jgi:FkbM family methyltransferase